MAQQRYLYKDYDRPAGQKNRMERPAPPVSHRMSGRQNSRFRARRRRRRWKLGFWLFVLIVCCGVGLRLIRGFGYGLHTQFEAGSFGPAFHSVANDDLTGQSAPGQGLDGWQLILVNEATPLPDDWQVTPAQLDNGECVDERILPALNELMQAAREQGVFLVVRSGWRSAQQQQQILDEKVQSFLDQGMELQSAQLAAADWVAQPGESEHETGLAVDLNQDPEHPESMDAYSWLAENAWQYGFIQRYPEGKAEITGISHEPWHYRYVGEQAAEEIWQQNICLEEYLAQVG
ncbi:MAG: M15 family metallopeptidase [Pygmaiobacter massiliensis]|nr:M15 family metallopeptidase [Pygmaiobacter massiliensis]